MPTLDGFGFFVDVSFVDKDFVAPDYAGTPLEGLRLRTADEARRRAPAFKQRVETALAAAKAAGAEHVEIIAPDGRLRDRLHLSSSSRNQ